MSDLADSLMMKVLSSSGKLNPCNIIFIDRKPIVNLLSLRVAARLQDYGSATVSSNKQPITLAFEYFHYRLDNILFRGTSFQLVGNLHRINPNNLSPPS